MESYKNQNLYVLSKKSSRPRGGAVLYLSKKIYVKVFELFFTSVNLQWRKKKKWHKIKRPLAEAVRANWF